MPTVNRRHIAAPTGTEPSARAIEQDFDLVNGGSVIGQSFSEAAIRDRIGLSRELVDLMEDAFAAMAGGEAVVPPVMQFLIDRHRSQTCVKGAYLPSRDVLCLKLVSAAQGLGTAGRVATRRSGMMLLFDAGTMALRALLADNGYLTQLRTAAAGGLCARLLAPVEVDVLGIVGTGIQAELQARAACLERRPRQIRIWGRNDGAAHSLAHHLMQVTGCQAVATRDLAGLVAASQLLITATRSTAPLIEPGWLHPQLHITALGSDAPGKAELAPELLRQADLYVPDSLEQAAALGELAHATACGIDHSTINILPLPDICAGRADGRSNDRQISIADLTGVGIQDAAIAQFAFDRLRSAESAGTKGKAA